MITIKELAQELNVSEQALRSWCKRNEIKKTTKGKITSYFLDDNAVESIRSYYTSQRKRNTTNTQRKHNESTTKATMHLMSCKLKSQRKTNKYQH